MVVLIMAARVACPIMHSPVKTERVQESRQSLHQQQYYHGGSRPEGEQPEESDEAHKAVHFQAHPEHHGPQHFRQLWWEKKKKHLNSEGSCGLEHFANVFGMGVGWG